MAQLPRDILSHSQKVCSLYKRGLLCLRDWSVDRLHWRYEAVKLRKRFDENVHILDLRYAKHLLLEGEAELWRRAHPQPLLFPSSPGSESYGRVVETPDFILDSWDPIEKAMYPKYFARREQRKKEYIEWYYTEYPEKKCQYDKRRYENQRYEKKK